MTAGGPALGPGGEFDRIRAFLRDLPPLPEGVLGPGDDAAVLPDGTVLSTDLSVEGVHFRLAWITPEEAGGRAVAAALSDLAAMAARPLGALVSLAVPPGGAGPGPWMAGVRERLLELDIPLLGGDLTRSPGPVVLDAVAVGRTEAPLLRSGARPGDELWVTGALGGAAAAVGAWSAGGVPAPSLRRRFARPRPRIPEALWLRERCDLTGGLDVSDGLAGDGGHLAAASRVGVILDGWRLPLEGDGEGEGGREAGLRRALHGGEDYELLLAAAPGSVEPRVEEFRRSFDLTLTQVGRVVRGEGVWMLHEEGGSPVRIREGGWDHFAGEGGEGTA